MLKQQLATTRSGSCDPPGPPSDSPFRVSLRAFGGCDRTHEPQFGNCIRAMSPMHITSASQPVPRVSLFAQGEPNRTDSGHALLVQLATLLPKSYNRSFRGRIRP